MRTRQTMTVSLPPAMVRQVEQVRKVEHRTRSELIREALRTYFRFRVVAASRSELEAMRLGRAEMRRGEYVSLDQLLHAVDNPRRKTGRKTA
jgi:metal-responsive CopG/Arc/MetJ family transcriptional regulator